MNVAETSFRVSLQKLQRIMRLGNGRRSSVYGIPYVFMQILWFWDFHVLERLERWQARFGAHVDDWFEAVGELEALCSLAAVASDHPQWTFPRVDLTATMMIAERLGHPLIARDQCRRNDVRLGPPGTFLLVTGSNMSGKSTLLRALGVNAILAEAGAPVCATALTMPRVELATSMRVTDSLNEGVSFFLAELHRLKEIVQRSAELAEAKDRRLLFLLDEILQGTNSAERHIAVAEVIGHLLDRPTLGAVSTHDLELANEPELAQRCQTVHFREQFTEHNGQRAMSFDYVLREGVSPTTNALKLLELVGLRETGPAG
jgi:DNA mismatch repair ATPase MutS